MIFVIGLCGDVGYGGPIISFRRISLMEWISVKDTQPKNDSIVLVSDGEHVTMAEWYVKGGWSLSREDKAVGVFPNSITHWMPLPAPPKTSQSAQRDPPASKK